MTRTVLIVDDQLGIRLLLEEIVKGEGYKAISCANGQQALDFVEQAPPDLIVIDFRLPIIDGATVIEKLEESGKYIPTIMMSGLAEQAKNKTKDFSSVKEVFSKPFNIEDARFHINRLLTKT
ncbi:MULTISPECIES: response regulator [Paraliobacillus]|uniref:response regulator n=1 Tax=Paraliobacillus TaxID=200903 RepID=UPI000DD3FF3F|nr:MULTISPECIES: response regulator [Paraliobacillus]